jgi:2-hydroxychromene-2-carboxylate isomerase
MTTAVTLFWSFRSPYSYVALPRVAELAEEFGVALDMRIVHPAAIRNPDYFRNMNKLARPYFLHDSARAAAFHGLPFRRPVPDPITQNQVTLAMADDHPLAHRLGRLGIAAVARGRGGPFCLEVSTMMWDGRVDNWHEGEHLAKAAARAGLDLSELETAIAADPDGHEAALADNDAALRKAGHWGVPTMVFEDEVFFGQDRVETLRWRMAQRLKEPIAKS